MCEDFLKKNHPTPKKNPAVVHAEKKPVHARKIPHPRQHKTFQIQLKPRRKKTFNLGFFFGVPVHAEIEPGHAEIICSPPQQASFISPATQGIATLKSSLLLFLVSFSLFL